MKPNTNTIVLTGGGSGGHITPLLSLAIELKKKDPKCQVVYIGLKGEKIEGLQSHYQAFDRVCAVPAGKFRRYHGESFLAHLADVKTLLLNVRDAFRVLRGILASRRLLKALKPALIFSKGGFVAVPVGIAAHRQKIPIITHDSDVLPGLANRILSRWAVVHATGMPAEYYNYPKQKTVYTGIPVNEKYQPLGESGQEEFKRQLGLEAGTPVVTVAGGGHGSQIVNQLLIDAVPKLFQALPNLHIFHFCGAANIEAVEQGYSSNLEDWRGRVSVKGFADDLYKYTGAADAVVARAGATTLAELAVQAKPAVIIPSPFLTGGHQLKNAQVLSESRAAMVIAEEEAAGRLEAALEELLKNKTQRQHLSDNIAKLAKPQATVELAAIILNHAGGAQA